MKKKESKYILFILVVIILNSVFSSCTTESHRINNSSGLWNLISTDSLYYEVYWDKHGGLFMFDGEWKHSVMPFEEPKSETKLRLDTLINYPHLEKEVLRNYMVKLFGENLNTEEMNLIGRYVYFIDSNETVNYNFYREEAYKRYKKWLHPILRENRDSSTEMHIEIIDRISSPN